MRSIQSNRLPVFFFLGLLAMHDVSSLRAATLSAKSEAT